MARTQDHLRALGLNPYPGRGIVIGRSAGGDLLLQVYWVMGRKPNSRNRRLVLDGTTVRTVPHDPSKVEDPSLIIYAAMRDVEHQGRRYHIATNGDQTDTIVLYVQAGATFEEALRSRTFEPDFPNNTSRISSIINPGDGTGIMWLTSRNPDNGEATHSLFEAEFVTKGVGYCIHTYSGDGSPLPSFRGDPYPVPVGCGVEDTAELLWSHLDRLNRVAIAVKGIDTRSGKVSYHIINQLGPRQ